MKLSNRLASAVLTISMFLTCLSPIPAKAAASEQTVNSEQTFMAALKDPSVSKITITENFNFTRPASDEPLIIPEHDETLVITTDPGVEMTLFHAGIILGGDTTFQDMTLTFTNSVRNAIVANGYTLTLENVKPARTSTWRTHLFCGEVTNYSGVGQLPASGSAGKIILQGNNEVGDIFAGSLSDVPDGSADQPNDFRQSATIIANQGKNGKIGTIYGCGARENRSGGQGDAWLVDADQYQASGSVTIELNGSGVQHVDGDTGTSTGANIIYNDPNEYLNSSLKLRNISGLDVQSGALELPSGSTFFGNDASIEISDKSHLNLKHMNDTLTAGDFTGHGVLILGEDQKITFNGNITGMTKVAIGNVKSGANSEDIPKQGHIYIDASNSNDTSFKLLPHQMHPHMELVRDPQGAWSVSASDSGTQQILLKDISITTPFTADNNIQVLIPVTVQYAANSSNALELLPFKAKTGTSGYYTKATLDGDIYVCTVRSNGVEVKLSFGIYGVDGTDQACLSIESTGAASIPSGNHTFDILIPKEYMENSQDQVLSTVLTVPDSVSPGPDPAQKIPYPTANTNLTYTGQEQTGVPEGNGYTLSDHKKTAAGQYRAIATLSKGFQWADGGTTPIEITWEIMPTPLTIRSATLQSKTYDGNTTAQVSAVDLDGVVSGEALTLNTDYTATGAFTDPNAGNNKTATVTVRMINQNYKLQNSVLQLTGQTILPQAGAPAPNVSGDYTVSTKYPDCFIYTVHPIQGAEYRMDSGAWQDSNMFDNITPLSTHTFSARIKQTSNQMLGDEGNSGAISFKKLDNPHIPSLIATPSGVSGNRTITIQPVNGAEYSFDGGITYDSDNSKSGCSGTIKIAIRYAETATHNASQAAIQNINTDKQAQAALTINAVGNKTYGDQPFILTAIGGSGDGALRFTSSDDQILSIDGNQATIKKAGSVDIIALKEDDATYNAISTTLPITIHKKALTIRAEDQSVPLGSALPTFTFHVEGLVNGDTFTSPKLTTTAKDTNTLGVFDIHICDGTLTNAESYTVTYVNGKLTVLDSLYALTVTGGSGSGFYQKGQTVGITADTREGYVFTEWTGDPGIIFADSKSKTTTFTMPGKAVSVTANYKAADTDSGSSGGGGSSGSSSNGSTSSHKTEVIHNSDGSITEVVKKPNGTIVESTKNPDGSSTVLTTQPDGTVITIETTKTGDRKEIVTKKDGSRLIQIKEKNGNASIVSADPSGKLNAQILLSEKSISNNQGEAFLLPLPQISVPHDEKQAPTLQISTNRSKEIEVTIPVDTGNPGIVAVLIHENGTQQILRKSIVHNNGVTVSLKLPTTIQLMDKSKTFQDVSPTYWANDGIAFVTARGIYGGTSSDKFDPETPMTRAMLVQVLHNLENNPQSLNTQNFSDVKSDAWYAGAIQWAVKQGLVKGTEENTFEPNKAITREQLAIILYRYSGKPTATRTSMPFQDANLVSEYAYPALNWAVDQAIIRGEDEGILDPKGILNRAECAEVLMRCLQAQESL